MSTWPWRSYAHVHHIVSNVSGLLRDGVSPIRRHSRAVSRRHHHRMPQGALHGDHRRARGRRARRLHGRDRILESRRQLRSQHPDPHDHRREATPLTFRAGAGIVADSSPDAGARGDARQGRRAAARAVKTPRHEHLDQWPARGRLIDSSRSRPAIRRRAVRDHAGAPRRESGCWIFIWSDLPRAAGASRSSRRALRGCARELESRRGAARGGGAQADRDPRARDARLPAERGGALYAGAVAACAAARSAPRRPVRECGCAPRGSASIRAWPE